MPTNVYDVLFKNPRTHRPLRSLEHEDLARAIVASGKMRIDAEDDANFARLTLPGTKVNHTFTQRELNDPKLVGRTESKLAHLLSQKYHRPEEVQRQLPGVMNALRENVRRRHGVSADVELQLARALVRCNAYAVMLRLHLENTEIYISFGHSVGEVMDIVTWQEHGRNSGLQAGGENAVYVSCGGNPFLEKDERRHTGDGEPALARLMIIAAQETGHHADMIRDARGRVVGRFSASRGGNAPSAKARQGRNADITRVGMLYKVARDKGLHRVAEWERQLTFYHEKNVTNAAKRKVWLLSRVGWLVLRILLIRGGLKQVKLQRSRYPASLLKTFFQDMAFNLAPEADVYRRKNPVEEEAIACIEALARVPQQVVKWGHQAVFFASPGLYTLYYNEVVPECAHACNRLRGVA